MLFFQRIFDRYRGFAFSLKDEPSLYDAKFREHAIKVMKTVDVAVGMLTDVANLLPVLEGLGEKHKCYGILPRDDVVGQALLETLALGLGDEFVGAQGGVGRDLRHRTTMIKGANTTRRATRSTTRATQAGGRQGRGGHEEVDGVGDGRVRTRTCRVGRCRWSSSCGGSG